MSLGLHINVFFSSHHFPSVCFINAVFFLRDDYGYEGVFFVSNDLLRPFLSSQPISNADFIVPVEIDGTVHQVL